MKNAGIAESGLKRLAPDHLCEARTVGSKYDANHMEFPLPAPNFINIEFENFPYKLIV